MTKTGTSSTKKNRIRSKRIPTRMHHISGLGHVWGQRWIPQGLEPSSGSQTGELTVEGSYQSSVQPAANSPSTRPSSLSDDRDSSSGSGSAASSPLGYSFAVDQSNHRASTSNSRTINQKASSTRRLNKASYQALQPNRISRRYAQDTSPLGLRHSVNDSRILGNTGHTPFAEQAGPAAALYSVDSAFSQSNVLGGWLDIDTSLRGDTVGTSVYDLSNSGFIEQSLQMPTGVLSTIDTTDVWSQTSLNTATLHPEPSTDSSWTSPVLLQDFEAGSANLQERETLLSENDNFLGVFQHDHSMTSIPGFPLDFDNFPMPTGGVQYQSMQMYGHNSPIGMQAGILPDESLSLHDLQLALPSIGHRSLTHSSMGGMPSNAQSYPGAFGNTFGSFGSHLGAPSYAGHNRESLSRTSHSMPPGTGSSLWNEMPARPPSNPYIGRPTLPDGRGGSSASYLNEVMHTRYYSPAPNSPNPPLGGGSSPVTMYYQQGVSIQESYPMGYTFPLS